MSKKIAVIGAGISGLSIAKMLCEAGEGVTVFEKDKQVGGLVKCTSENGVLFHKVGGHVFNSKNEAVLDWFWSKFNKDKEFSGVVRNAKVFHDDTVVGYPFENFIYTIDKDLGRQIFSELIESKTDISTINNFHDFLEGNFGQTLFEIYFKPYNEKIWKTDLKQIPLPWLKGKLPMPSLLDIINNNVYRATEKNMVHSSFFYPNNLGSQFIANRLSEGLEVRHNCQIHQIHRNSQNLWVIGEECFETVIYTGDVRKLSQMINIDGLPDVSNFKSNGTTTVLCSIDSTDRSWMYLPNPGMESHRIIYTGNFSKNNNSESILDSCTIEFTGKFDKDTIMKELKKLPGSPSFLAMNYEPNSYVIQDFDTRAKVNNMKERLATNNIFLLGRFAEWEYYNMDAAMEAAMKLLNTLKPSL